MIKHSKELLVIIAEATLEKMLIDDVKKLGAHGYNITEVRGSGDSGDRDGIWEADRTIRMEVICETRVAEEIECSLCQRRQRKQDHLGRPIIRSGPCNWGSSCRGSWARWSGARQGK